MLLMLLQQLQQIQPLSLPLPHAATLRRLVEAVRAPTVLPTYGTGTVERGLCSVSVRLHVCASPVLGTI